MPFKYSLPWILMFKSARPMAITKTQKQKKRRNPIEWFRTNERAQRTFKDYSWNNEEIRTCLNRWRGIASKISFWEYFFWFIGLCLFCSRNNEESYYSTKHWRTSTGDIEGPVELDLQYLLIVDADQLLVEIDHEIDMIHNFVKEIDRKRFPEWEQWLQFPFGYLETNQVKFIHIFFCCDQTQTFPSFQQLGKNINNRRISFSFRWISLHLFFLFRTILSEEELFHLMEAIEIVKRKKMIFTEALMSFWLF